MEKPEVFRVFLWSTVQYEKIWDECRPSRKMPHFK